VVFDPATFAAAADYEHPTRLSTGVRWALVNGRPAIEDGRPTLALAGKSLRRPAHPDWKCTA
jgi:N-acyl-D-amino-acid deacylase